ncbi:MAG: 3-deoxy-manno-octulosonate cytidylyltransferase [Gemmatimonadota bacterium]
MSDQVLGIIPARIASTRLPQKPLHRIAGRPLLEWVWRRVRAIDLLDTLVIATDSDEVASVARDFGADVVLTSADHPSGTDRVAEVAFSAPFADHEIIVNVQGDEPLLSSLALQGALDCVHGGGWDIGTCATPLQDQAEWRDPSVVKVVTGARGRALYFSRAPIPHPREGEPRFGIEGPWLRHVGLYVYRRGALRSWVDLEPSRLERVELLEQLRPLEAGLGIGVAVVPEAEGGVDTLDDARRVEARLIEWERSGYV